MLLLRGKSVADKHVNVTGRSFETCIADAEALAARLRGLTIYRKPPPRPNWVQRLRKLLTWWRRKDND